jgi:carboxylesterase
MAVVGHMRNEESNSRTDLPAPGNTAASPLCLVLHGLGGGPYELGPLIAALEADGLRVDAPILPGHEPTGPVMPASSWRDWATASEAAFDALAAAGGPVVVIGFSTGATLALRLATRRPVARMVLLAPFLAIRYSGLIPLRPASYLRHIAKLIPDLPRRPPAVRDPAMRRWASGQDGFRTFNLHSSISALELIDEVTSLVTGITTPTLIIQGTLDTVVEPINARWLHRQLGATTKALISLLRSDHLVALDRDRHSAITATLEFVCDGTLPRAPDVEA